MKKQAKIWLSLLLGLVFVLSIGMFAACGEAGDPKEPENPGTEEPTDDDGSIVGDYTMTDANGVVYKLTIDQNNDYSMVMTKTVGAYTVNKLYMGPLHHIDGKDMAVMPVFLSDAYYEGEGAPQGDPEDLLYNLLNQAYADNKGMTEADRECYITVDTTAKTFTVKADQEVPIDLTGDYWSVAELQAAGYEYVEASN